MTQKNPLKNPPKKSPKKMAQKFPSSNFKFKSHMISLIVYMKSDFKISETFKKYVKTTLKDYLNIL